MLALRPRRVLSTAGARSFNGTTDVITVPARQMPQSAFTIAAWVKPTLSVSGDAAAVRDATTGSYTELIVGNTGLLLFRLETNSANFVARQTNASVLPANVWSHVAGTWDGGTTDASIGCWVNGSKVDTTNAGAGIFTGPYSGSAVPFTIGSRLLTGAVNNPFPGSVGQVAVWSVLLSPPEIQALASGLSPSSIRPQSLFGYWPLDGIDHPALDHSIYRNNGVLTGTSLVIGPPLIVQRPRFDLVPFGGSAGAGGVIFRRSPDLMAFASRTGSRQAWARH